MTYKNGLLRTSFLFFYKLTEVLLVIKVYFSLLPELVCFIEYLIASSGNDIIFIFLALIPIKTFKALLT